MKFLKALFFLTTTLCIISCDNDVDINSDFEEVTLVYGLLDVNSDTQFVKINRTFLDDQLSAIDLAKQVERTYYDSLTVSLTNEVTNAVIPLLEITKPKNPGIFSTEENVMYYTVEKLSPKTAYRLKIVKADGSETYGSTTTIERVDVLNPKVVNGTNISRNNVSFTNRTSTAVTDYVFKFRPDRNVGEFEVKMTFFYTEETPNGNIPGKVEMNISRFFPELRDPTDFLLREFTTPFKGELFFRAIEEQVPSDDFPTKKVIKSTDNIEIEVYAADRDYTFYRELNGPIDGLAQTRPEFTNVENGIGLFASRYSLIAKSQISESTTNYLIQRYRSSRNFSTEQ